MRPLAGITPRAAGTGVDGLERRVRGLSRGERRAAAAAGIAEAGSLQRLQRCLVFVDSIRLELNASIPFEAECLERRRKIGCERRPGPLAIEVVDPEQPAPATAARVQVAAGGRQ
jgi:hypothetical protein